MGLRRPRGPHSASAPDDLPLRCVAALGYRRRRPTVPGDLRPDPTQLPESGRRLGGEPVNLRSTWRAHRPRPDSARQTGAGPAWMGFDLLEAPTTQQRSSACWTAWATSSATSRSRSSGITSARTTPATCTPGRPPSRGWCWSTCRRTRRSWTLWANLKGRELANRCCADRRELIATAQVGSIRARRDPDLLRSFLAGTGLTI
jgi:hypothetical protein